MYDEDLGIHTAINTMYACVFLNIRTCGAESAPAAIAALLSARVFLQLPTFLASRHLEICLSTVCRLCTISFASVECLLALSIRPSLKINNHVKCEKQSTAKKWHAFNIFYSQLGHYHPMPNKQPHFSDQGYETTKTLDSNYVQMDEYMF